MNKILNKCENCRFNKPAICYIQCEPRSLVLDSSVMGVKNE